MRPAVFSIDPDRPFLDTLAAGLRARAGSDPLNLARQTILLPTRRACRALRESFLRLGGGQALLLPRLVPVGDLDAEELAILGDEGGSEGGFDIAPAIPELKRHLALTRLVLAWGTRHGGGPLTAGQAAPLAAALARFLDEVHSEGATLTALANLVPEEHAEHWQLVLKFLNIIAEHWPRELAELQGLDAGERRNLVLARQRTVWRTTPPRFPVIAAGITGSVPAVADLVVAVAHLEQGSIVLPGLDRYHDDETWDEIRRDPTHPQHLLARLLDRLDLTRDDVASWPAGPAPVTGARQHLVAEALRPAASSHRWRELSGFDAEALNGLRRIDCPGPREEAAVIALLLRQQLNTPGRTAALVTPDRGLARRVAAELKRWGVEIDDSAGLPLNRTPPGVFLRLLLDAAAEDFAPVPLLALLKHPLAAGGHSTEVFRSRVRDLERAALRGPRPAPGLDGLARALPPAATLLRQFVTGLDAALAPLVTALHAPEIDLKTLAAAHVTAAEALAATAEERGAERLWREPAGEMAALFLNELLQAATDFPPIEGASYPALFEALLAGRVVRPAYGRHPRLFIWGLLEARLQHTDLIVLGSLNEGDWPPEADSDPWLSRPMRKEFGLAPPERRIGAAAHDFAQALGAEEVVLTRATRVDGTPTVPSRWLLRLDTVLRAAGLRDRLTADADALLWQALLDRPPAAIRLAPPAPRPPLAARPRQLSVTQIETWMRDPYAIYARVILRLKALDPLDADPGAAERGEFIHQALDAFVRAYPHDLPRNATDRLIDFGRTAFGEALDRPGVRTFWWPRFERIAQWFVATETDRRAALAASSSEILGRLVIEAPGGPFTLTAKADRIDQRREGGLAIIDYKTGAKQSPGDIEAGFLPQLPLEAAIAAAGGFAGIPAAPVTDAAFWRLKGGDPAGAIDQVGTDSADLQRLAAEALAGLRRLVAEFDDPDTPYYAVPRPERAPRYSDYRHLARIKEWATDSADGE